MEKAETAVHVISYLKVNEIAGTFCEGELQKANQK